MAMCHEPSGCSLEFPPEDEPYLVEARSASKDRKGQHCFSNKCYDVILPEERLGVSIQHDSRPVQDHVGTQQPIGAPDP